MHRDAVSLLRTADPAVALAPDPDLRERTRAFVLAQPRVVPGRTRGRRRVLVAVASIVAALVVAGAGWTAYSSLVTGPEPARDEFHATTRLLTLPPGAQWREPAYGDALYGRHAGRLDAVFQATCAWFDEWSAAAVADDAARVARAEAAVARVRSLMPLHRAGDPEEAGGFDAASLAWFDRIVREARGGDLAGVDAYRRANCAA